MEVPLADETKDKDKDEGGGEAWSVLEAAKGKVPFTHAGIPARGGVARDREHVPSSVPNTTEFLLFSFRMCLCIVCWLYVCVCVCMCYVLCLLCIVCPCNPDEMDAKG